MRSPIEDRDEASIAAASTWAETKFVRFFCMSSDTDVLTATAGNVLLGLQDLKRRRTVFLWHDADASSALGRPYPHLGCRPRGRVGGPGGYLNPEIDGDETSVLPGWCGR